MRHYSVCAILSAIVLFTPSSFSGSKNLPIHDDLVPGEILVRLKNNADTQIFSNVGATVLKSYSLVPGLFHLRVQEGSEAKVMRRLTRRDDVVLYAEPNIIYRVTVRPRGTFTLLPNDERFDKLWGLHNTGQSRGSVEDADIDAPEAWALGHVGSHDVVVAVIDTGIDLDHPDLVDNLWTNEGEIPNDEIDNDKNGFIDDLHGWNFVDDNNDPMDRHGHGSHTSGTIGAVGNNDIGVVGVNWHVKIIPLQFLDEGGGGSSAYAISAIEYATRMGAKVLNNSYGSTNYSQAMFDAIQGANEAGVLFVASAGNSAKNNDKSSHYPSNYKIENVIAVAAFDDSNRIARYSSFGPNSVHVAAPGSNIMSTTIDRYGSKSGTSMATPHVVGVAALIMAAEPHLSHLEVKERILNTAEEVPSLVRKLITGGRINADYALRNIPQPRHSEPPFDPTPQWQIKNIRIQTPHPYSNMYRESWIIHHPGAIGLHIHFRDIRTENKLDVITVSDAEGRVYDILNGHLGELWSYEVPGERAIISFEADGVETDWGFQVIEYAYRMK